MSAALVTGATGFIGNALVRRLIASGDQVRALVRRDVAPGTLDGADLVRGDLADVAALTDAVAGVDVVYHVAGCIKAVDSRDYERVNVEGTRNVAAACAACEHPPVLVFVSSISAGGPTRRDLPHDEAAPSRPVSAYGRSKLRAEEVLRTFADRVPISIVRPPIVVGPGDPSLLPVFRGVARFGVHLAPGLGRERHSYVCVEDLCRALRLVAEAGERLPSGDRSDTPAGQGAYYVAFDERPTYAELGRRVGEAVGRKRVFVFSPPGPLLIWSVAFGTEVVARWSGRPSLFGVDKVRDARAGSWLCDDAKIRRQLGFRPTTTLDERLRAAAGDYRASGLLRSSGPGGSTGS